MKKLAVLLAVISVAVLAAPALSATNPFMDVPMNHWAYDAIGQLAAHGILSGYPDGLYKGQQATTRYEMASALARALAVVDMTKASKQDVEMLKKLVVEFKDELEALGVRVDELDSRVAVLEERLGGWHIHGTLVLDVINKSAENAFRTSKSDGTIGFDEARLLFERTWTVGTDFDGDGQPDEAFFRARLRNESGRTGQIRIAGESTGDAYMDRFYVDMPFFGDTKLTIGRFLWDWESAYRVGGSYRMWLDGDPEDEDGGRKFKDYGNATGSWFGDSILTDWTWTGFGLTKNFGLGQVQAVFAHPDYYSDHGTNKNWMLMGRGSFQFTERVGFDIGGQAFIGDNAETFNGTTSQHVENDYSFNSLWTIFAGLRFNFNENIAFKGNFYYQKIDSEIVAYGNDNLLHWYDYGYGDFGLDEPNYEDNAKHWRVMLDVNQDALKFTGLWLEYGQYDKGFWAPEGWNAFFPSESSVLDTYKYGGRTQLATDMKYWRVVLTQFWNEQWSTHLFYYGYKLDNALVDEDGNRSDAKPSEYGVGVQYTLNDYTTMGLNYMHVDNGADQDNEDNIIRFRTSVSF